VSGPIDLGWPQVAGAAALVLVNGGISLAFHLGLERRLLIASARTLVQLLALGWILTPVFRLGSAWPVLALALIMVTLASFEAVGRSKRRFAGMRAQALGAMIVGGMTTAVFGSAVLVGTDPWWKPQYLIPLLGMILGNSLTGISLGLDKCTELLDTGRDRVEALLALGATRTEAGRPVAVESLRTGMIPILNAMAAVGLVTIPGMMTGQILGGTGPQLAARYQMLIMFLIASSTAAGVTLAVLASLRSLFDADHRLRVDRLHEKK
jgi:putative ABC transport system permease protein